jgi:malonyl CoA-acyl carrier protein transacylase
MKTFLFPGQGSQSVGMGGELFDEFEELTQKADEVLGFSIKELCLEDPKKILNQTQFTQPALYVVNALSYYRRVEKNKKPDFLAGHSLGEFNALVAAECFDFEAGLKLVKKRGELMSRASGGGMAAILNLSEKDIEAILKQNDLLGIDLANFNTASQIVISGLKEEIAQAETFFKEAGATFIPLKTSGAFHSRYMEASKAEFEKYFKKFKFSDLKIPVISNVSAKPYRNTDVMENLANQITSSVRWHESIQYLMKMENMEFEEIGNGNVLTKMVNKIRAEDAMAGKKEIDNTNNVDVKTKEAAPKAKNEQQDSDQGKCQKDSEFSGQEHEKDQKIEHLSAEEKVQEWNQKYSVGTRINSLVVDDEDLETRTEAVVLFGHRAAVYVKGYNGYFDLDEITPL